METLKETAANVAASAKAGLEKTKATLEEKVEKMSTHDPMKKQIAKEKKEERIMEAEIDKRQAHEHNAVAKQAAKAGAYTHYTSSGPAGDDIVTYTRSVAGTTGYPTGSHQVFGHAGAVEPTHPPGYNPRV